MKEIKLFLAIGTIFELYSENQAMKYLFIISLILVGFTACKSQEEIVSENTETPSKYEESTDQENADPTEYPDEEVTDSKPKRPYQLKAQIGDISQRSDFYEIKSASIEGNKMYINIQYSGGCERHTFELLGSEGVLKSLPPQRAIRLIHHNNDDMCESIVNETIEADLTDLAFEKTRGSEIVLNLDGYSKPLKFIYQ